MPGMIYKSEDLDEQQEERVSAILFAIDAMVSAHHVDIMDKFFMPHDFFSNAEAYPDSMFETPMRQNAYKTIQLMAPMEEESVLRGGSSRSQRRA